MEQTRALRVTVDGREYRYPAGTAYRAVAADVQSSYDHDILLVERDGKLQELHKTLDRDCALRMVTSADPVGMQTYERSLVLLLMKAFNDVAGERLVAEFTLDRALFVHVKGASPVDRALLEKVEGRMRALAAQSLPIVKSSLDTEDAIALFRRAGMEDKAKLLGFRINSHVNVYTLDGYTDYFYGYMVDHTGCLKRFALEPYADGFVLRLPDRKNPEALGEFRPSRKVFDALSATNRRFVTLGVSNVAELNEVVARGDATELILAQEALMEKQIGDIAQEIASRRDVRFVMIAGPSSSGKTTFSHRLCTQLVACGKRPHPIATDNYFKNREDTPLDEEGKPDFESLRAMDVEGFNADMARLLNGERVELPQYNFKKGAREYNGSFLQLGPQDVLVIEGIHCLNDDFSRALPRESKYRVYISCLTTLNVDDHNRIPTTDARLLRRIERDARTRGYSAQATIRLWPSVRNGEEHNIFPYQDSADVIFNSALIYETALLKTYVEPLLLGVERDSEEYLEAKRLLKFLSYLLPLPGDDVPRTSLMREFIGGGCYNV